MNEERQIKELAKMLYEIALQTAKCPYGAENCSADCKYIRINKYCQYARQAEALYGRLSQLKTRGDVYDFT